MASNIIVNTFSKHSLFYINASICRQTVPVRGVKTIVLHRDVIRKQVAAGGGLDSALQQTVAEARLNSAADMPLTDMANPYTKPQKKCILCEHNVQLDYKNLRLLSQFISPHTGQIYGRRVTGLCIFMQKRVSILVKRARYFGFLPYVTKDPNYLKDPKLFDPFRRM